MANPYITGYQGNFNPSCLASIANGQTVSSIINCGGFVLCGILLPAAFTGVALTFEASIDGINFFPVNNTTSGTALTYTVAEGTYCAIDPKDFQGIQYLKIVSGSTEEGARNLYCSLKGF